MAGGFISVVAPDGETGEIPEDQLEGALAAGFTVAGQPSAVTAPAAPAPERLVAVIAPDGEEGELPESQLEGALQAGFRTPQQVAEEQANSGLGSRIAAGFEGIAQGVMLGAQTPIAAVEALGATIGDRMYESTHGEAAAVPYTQRLDEAQQGVSLREEYNPITSGAGELVGVVAPALLTGGASLAPSGLAARGGTALANRAMARVAPSALRGLARPAAGLLTQGAVEGAAYAAAKEVDQALITGDYEGLAEKVLISGSEGALYGSLASVGGGAAFKLAQTAGRGAGKLVPGIRRLAGESAYKAAVGRTSKQAIQAAERHGGADAVGQTLLDEGIPLTAAADDIYTAVSARADEVGAELGALRNEVDDLSGGKGMSRSKLWALIDEQVIAPLRKSPINRDLAEQLEARFGPLRDELMRARNEVVVRGKDGAKRLLDRDRITFDELHGLRREIDQRLNWDKVAPDAALQARKDIRNTIEDFWIQSADEVAEQAGQLGYAEKLKGLKQRYARLALARDQAEQAVITQLANRSTSLTDTIAGAAAGGAAGDPITGFLASQLHKYVRERGRGYVAVGLNKLANILERPLSDQAMTAAARSQQRLNAASALKGLLVGGGGTRAARSALTFEQVDQALADYEPGSDESLRLAQTAEHIAEDSPELAQAIVAQAERRAAFIRSKAGPPPTETPFGTRTLRDDVTQEKLGRYIEAAQDPIAALERLADGDVRREDVETLQAVAPRLLDELRRKSAVTLASAEDPGYEARLQIGMALGLEADPSLAPDSLAFYQEIAAPAPRESAQAPSRTSTFKANGESYETKAQRVSE